MYMYNGVPGRPKRRVDGRPSTGRMAGMAPRSLRTWWIRTIVANFLGIAILLIGWGTNSNILLALGFLILVVSLGVRVAAQLTSSRRRR